MADDLQSVVKSIRKKPHNFAAFLGKEGVVFIADIRKSPQALKKQAKSDGGGAKGATGVARVDSGTLVLSCEEEPPGMLLRQMKKSLLSAGVKLKLAMEMPDGSVLGGEISDEGEEKTAASDEPDSLQRDIAAIRPQAKRLIAVAGQADAFRVKKMLDGLEAAAEIGKTARARDTLSKLKVAAVEIAKRREEQARKRRAGLSDIRSRAEAAQARLKLMRAEGGGNG